MSKIVSELPDHIRIDVSDLVEDLRRHPLYESVSDEPELRLLMSNHVFAVWDFQSLLKSLQRELTCVDVPWLPTSNPLARRFVNEIVLDEESDHAPGGGYLSHFELYLLAMDESGADRSAIDRFIVSLRDGCSVDESLNFAAAPPGVAQFVRNTLDIARSGQPHRIAAAFALGREEVIPAIFRRLVDRLAVVSPERWSTFRHYLNRHIGHDEDVHGPLALEILAQLCGDDDKAWSEAAQAARVSLQARLTLWDHVLEMIRNRK